jgi:hypothetical protein
MESRRSALRREVESLADRLAAQLEVSRSKRTDEENRLVDAAIRELAESDAVERALGVGSAAPDFLLPNQVGRFVSEAEARARGAYVLSFYRGGW